MKPRTLAKVQVRPSLVGSLFLTLAVVVSSLAGQPAGQKALSARLEADAGNGSVQGTLCGVPVLVTIDPIGLVKLRNGGSVTKDLDSYNVCLGPLSVMSLQGIHNSLKDVDEPRANSGRAQCQVERASLLGGLITLTKVNTLASVETKLNPDGKSASAVIRAGTTIEGLSLNGGCVPLPQPMPANYSIAVSSTLPCLGLSIPVQGCLVLNQVKPRGGVGSNHVGVTAIPVQLFLSGFVPGLATVSVNVEIAGTSLQDDLRTVAYLQREFELGRP